MLKVKIDPFLCFNTNKMETSQIKLFQNYSDNVIEFENLDDFNNYYKINKADIDKLSTNALNRKFRVKNHRIGRKKGVIYLFPVKTNNVETTQTSTDGLSIDEKLNRLNNRLKNIETILTSLMEALFSDQNESNTSSQYRTPSQTSTNSRFNTNYI